MVELVRQCASLRAVGTEVILCSSGAIAAGRERLGFPQAEGHVAYKQMLAAVGQSNLMSEWENLFGIYNLIVGQVLLTRADVRSRLSFLNARDTIQALLEHGIVPIVNENDAVATSEIRVGDNDNLSALVALLSEANLLLILTDQRGLFTSDPTTNPEAELIPEVQHIDAALRNRAGDSTSGLGVGGMTTKLQAADTARRAGADVVIASGHATDVVLRAARRERVGTYFPALETSLEQRKKRILAGSNAGGKITVDTGAARAVSERGSSLLPAGITAVSGKFDRGDTVVILSPSGAEVARGIARYGSNELQKLAGAQSSDIESRLGYAYGPVAVHRNDMIVTQERSHG
jgi:glutamate 5-kinase